jgi:hypothetical protein
MEQKLYENDRAFVDRVRSEGPHSMAKRALRWSVLIFAAGFAILLVSFRSSLVLGTFGFLVMLLASFLFERSARQAYGTRGEASTGRPQRGRVLTEELSMIGRKLRSRSKFRRDH